MKKTIVINAMDEQPIEELTEKLIVIEKINKGLEDIQKGKVVGHDEVKGIVNKFNLNN